MKRTLEWSAPERTVVDSVSALTRGLESLIAQIGDLDAPEQANRGALQALESGIRLPLQDVVDDSLDWVRDVSSALDHGWEADDCSSPHADIVAHCFAAKADFRRARSGLQQTRDNVYSALTQLKDITRSVRAALGDVVVAVDAIEDDEEKAHHCAELLPEQSRTPEADSEHPLGVTHEYRQSGSARVERVVGLARKQDCGEKVLFTEISAAARARAVRARPRRESGVVAADSDQETNRKLSPSRTKFATGAGP